MPFAKTSTPVLLALALTATADAAPAAPPASLLTPEELVRKLEAAGYAEIDKLTVAAGLWEGQGVRSDVWIAFQADPRTGALVSEHPID